MGLGAIAACLWLRRRRGEPLDLDLLFWGALLLVALGLALLAVRMGFYSQWLALPPLAALVAEIMLRLKRRDLLLASGLGFGLAGAVPTAALNLALAAFVPGRPPGPADHCSEPSAYATLAQLPPGLTVAEIDIGPYILASTRGSVLSAPYHRMAWGMIKGASILSSPTPAAETPLRALGARYVLDCPVHSRKWSLWRTDALQRRLDRDDPPAWLERVSKPGDAVRVYRMR
jgi:hypothetical protein